MVEEWLFFNQYNFNKQKLVLHRAGMKFYEEYLRQKNFKIQYIDAQDDLCDVRKLIPHLSAKGIKRVHMAQVADD
jgi:deoxyribodipyrimidine photolyase-related protein